MIDACVFVVLSLAVCLRRSHKHDFALLCNLHTLLSSPSKLISLGCPAHTQPGAKPKAIHAKPETQADKDFRDLAMHGLLERMKELVASNDKGLANPNAAEAGSGRTPLHKAAYFGHLNVVTYLVNEAGAVVDTQDVDGDTALHDAARFGHVDIAKALLAAGASAKIQNMDGKTARDLAMANDKDDVVDVLDGKSDNCVTCTVL